MKKYRVHCHTGRLGSAARMKLAEELDRLPLEYDVSESRTTLTVRTATADQAVRDLMCLLNDRAPQLLYLLRGTTVLEAAEAVQ